MLLIWSLLRHTCVKKATTHLGPQGAKAQSVFSHGAPDPGGAQVLPGAQQEPTLSLGAAAPGQSVSASGTKPELHIRKFPGQQNYGWCTGSTPAGGGVGGVRGFTLWLLTQQGGLVRNSLYHSDHITNVPKWEK